MFSWLNCTFKSYVFDKLEENPKKPTKFSMFNEKDTF